MNMASRNIANMHLFLEMKKKFPDLPEDTLREYVFLYAEDQDKCVSLLQKESKNHFHSSQLFSDYHLFENRAQLKKNDNVETNSNSLAEISTSHSLYLPNTNNILKPTDKQQESPHEAVTSTSCKSLPNTPVNSNVPLKPNVQNPYITSNYGRAVSETSKPFSLSSHNAVCPRLSDQINHDRMMFSTTKEHKILPLEVSKKNEQTSHLPDHHELEPSRQHAVSLSITPSFPYVQQQMNVVSSTVSTTTSHSFKPGRHTTSLNLQLQPHSSDPYPLEISTIPTNIGSSSNYSDFGSHLHISVGSQGATFTALRLQRPPVTQNQLPAPEETSVNYSQSSSHVQNSKAHKYPILETSCPFTRELNLPLSKKYPVVEIEEVAKVNGSTEKYSEVSTSSNQKSGISFGNLNVQTNFGHGYQASPDYMQAVKKHQLAQLDLLRAELNKEKDICSGLKFEVNKLEQELMQKKEKENSLSCAEALKKLKEENRKLRIECNCLLMEYDMCSKGQIPVGMTDEDFYSNIFMGPNDSLSKYAKEELKSEMKFSHPESKSKLSTEEEDDKNKWLCKKCTFANHPALEKCEMCELPKNTSSFFDDD